MKLKLNNESNKIQYNMIKWNKLKYTKTMSVLILLGGPLTIDNKPGTWLKSRLDKAIKVYNEYNFD